MDGVTVSGGEPFEQTSGLLKLVRLAKSKGVSDILVYTGYTLEELLARGDADTLCVLNEIAVLIDGPYVAELDSGKGNLKGSENQRVIFINEQFTALYRSYYCEERSMQQIQIGNYVVAAGISSEQYLREFLRSDNKTGD